MLRAGAVPRCHAEAGVRHGAPNSIAAGWPRADLCLAKRADRTQLTRLGPCLRFLHGAGREGFSSLSKIRKEPFPMYYPTLSLFFPAFFGSRSLARVLWVFFIHLFIFLLTSQEAGKPHVPFLVAAS